MAGTVFLGIVLFVANLDASGNLSASYQRFYDDIDMADVWATGGDVDALAIQVSAEPAATVDVRRRADVAARIAGRELVVSMLGTAEDGVDDVNRRFVTDGRDVTATDADSAVLETHAAEHFGIVPGDSIELWDGDRWRPVEVVGIAASGEYLFPARSHAEVFTVPDEFGVVFVPDALAGSIAPDATRQLMARVEGRDVALTSRLLDLAVANGAADVYGLDDQPSNLALQSDVKGFESMSYLFPVLFLGAAGMATFVLLSRLVRQERTQIGMLLADGVATRTILRHYATHAVVITLMGAVPGLLVGSLLGRWMTGLYTDFLGVPLAVTRSSMGTLAEGMLFAVVVGVIAGVAPARAAARIEPAEAMRPPTPTGVDGRVLLERVWPVTLPMTARVVARNLARNPRRVVTTAVGVVLSMVVLVTSMALNDTTNSVIDRQFDLIDRRDLTIHFDHHVATDDLDRLTADPRVARAEPAVEEPVVISHDGATSDNLLQVFVPGTAAHGFASDLPPDGLVVGSVARDALGVSLGDAVTVFVPGEPLAAETVVAGFVDEPIPSVSYLSLDSWVDVGGSAPTTAVVTLVDHDTHGAVRDELATREDIIAITDHRAMIETVRELLSVTLVFVALMVLFAVLMTIGLLYNAVTVALAERTNEMATLQANGMPRRWIRSTITAETVVVVVLGLLPGTLAGWWVAGRFLGQFDNESFNFRMVLNGSSLGLAAALVLGVAVVSQLPGLRRIDRLDLPAVVRERSV